MPTVTNPGVFHETQAGLRRLVLILYGLVGPVFTAVLFFLGGHDRPWHLLAVVALIVAGAVWLYVRPNPRTYDFVFPTAVSPTLCCGIAYAACGVHGGAYLGVMGAPLAWSAVLMETPVAIAAWLTAVGSCFVVVSLEAGPATGALNTVVLGTIYALVGWVVNGLAKQLRRTRAELASKNERDAGLLQAIPDTLALVDLEGRFLDVQNCAGSMLPVPCEQLIGRCAFEWMEPDVASRMREALANVAATGEVQVVEYSATYGDATRWFESRLARAGADRVVVIRRDVTPRREAELALEESERRLALAIQASGAGAFDWDLRQGKVTRDAGFASLLGQMVEELGTLPEDWSDRIHPDDRASAVAARDAYVEGRTSKLDFEYRMRVNDGSFHWLRTRAKAVERDDAGRALRIVGTVSDVDVQHRERERALREARLRGLENRINEIELVLRVDGSLIEVNDRALAAYGYTREEMLRLNGRELRVPSARAAFVGDLRRAVEEGGIHIESEHVRRDGSVFPVAISARAFTVGEEQYVHTLVRDLTEERLAQAERARAAEVLHRLNQELEQRVAERTAEVQDQAAEAVDFLDRSGDLIHGTDTEGHILFVSRAWCEALGYTAEEALTLTFFDVVAPEQHAAVREILAAMVSERHRQISWILRTRIGSSIETEGTVSSRTRAGTFNGVLVVLRDVTARRSAEEARQRSHDRLAAANAALERASRAKDDFLAAVSHELRTPLNGVLGLSEALDEDVYGELTEPQRVAVRRVRDSGRRLLALINDILELSSMEAGMAATVIAPLNDACRTSLHQVQMDAERKGLRVAYQIDDHGLAVNADPRRLGQVLLRLLDNAVKFTPEGGTIGIDVSSDAAMGEARIVVWDTGIGIALDDQARLFQPFVQLDASLARKYPGTGLGLALVRRSVELHGGRVSVESRVGEGSRFSVTLPLAARQVTPAESQPREAAPAASPAREVPPAADSAPPTSMTRRALSRSGTD